MNEWQETRTQHNTTQYSTTKIITTAFQWYFRKRVPRIENKTK